MWKCLSTTITQLTIKFLQTNDHGSENHGDDHRMIAEE